VDKETITLIIIVVIVLFLVGNLSTVHKTSNKPLRKKGLNDLKETLPRSNKTESALDTFETKTPNATKSNSSANKSID